MLLTLPQSAFFFLGGGGEKCDELIFNQVVTQASRNQSANKNYFS